LTILRRVLTGSKRRVRNSSYGCRRGSRRRTSSSRASRPPSLNLNSRGSGLILQNCTPKCTLTIHTQRSLLHSPLHTSTLMLTLLSRDSNKGIPMRGLYSGLHQWGVPPVRGRSTRGSAEQQTMVPQDQQRGRRTPVFVRMSIPIS
jgi:hypothetical protein